MPYFVSNHICSNCGKSYDGTRQQCPECQTPNEDPRARRFRGFEAVGWKKELGLGLGGYFGLQFLVLIIEIVMMGAFLASYVGDDPSAAFSKYVMEPQNLALIQYVSYGLLALFLCLLIFNDWKRILRGFRWEKPLIGVAFLAAMLAFSYLYQLILHAAGVEISDNQNQTLVVSLVKYNPALAIIFLGLLGPLCEELMYRVGLFSFLKRIHPAVAYVLTGIIFGLIHFDFGNAGSPNEWLNLPTYVVSGLLLCFAYDKKGLWCSFTAHALNNVLSVILILI